MAYLTTFLLTVAVFVALILIDVIVRRDYKREHNLGVKSKI